MTSRPIFIPVIDLHSVRLVKEVQVRFNWHPGFAPIQKKKNIQELHESAKKLGILKLLEVSTKSEDEIGKLLSAFNLRFTLKEFGELSVESAFQGSKIFENGGPFQDIYGKGGFEIKKDQRLKQSGKIIGFKLCNDVWDLEPKTAFYDWIYLRALVAKRETAEKLLNYDGFTDIEFNPKKSINCQARTCALFVAIHSKGLLRKVISDKDYFLKIMREGIRPNESGELNQKEFNF